MSNAFQSEQRTANATGVGFGDGFGGIRVMESQHCQERRQWRFPRSKKKRIRNKWSNREENFRYIPMAVWLDSNRIMAHPSLVQRLREEMPPDVRTETPPLAGD